MNLRIVCPRCRQQLAVADNAIGKAVQCPSCRTVIGVRGPQPQPPRRSTPAVKAPAPRVPAASTPPAKAPVKKPAPAPVARKAVAPPRPGPTNRNVRKPAPRKQAPGKPIDLLPEVVEIPDEGHGKGGGLVLWVVLGLVLLLLLGGGGVTAILVLRSNLAGTVVAAKDDEIAKAIQAQVEEELKKNPPPNDFGEDIRKKLEEELKKNPPQFPNPDPPKTDPGKKPHPDKKSDPEKKPDPGNRLDPGKKLDPGKDGARSGGDGPVVKPPALPPEKPVKDNGPQPQAVLPSDKDTWPMSVAFGREGKTVVVAFRSGFIKEWDPATQQSKEILPLGDDLKKELASVALSPDGKTAAVISKGGMVLVDESGKPKATLEPAFANLFGTFRALFSPDGKYVAGVLPIQGGLKLAEAEGGKVLTGVKGTVHGVEAVAFAPDSKTVAVAGKMGADVTLWDLATLKQTAALRLSFQSDLNPSAGLAFSPDGKFLAVTCGEGVRIWDLATRRQRPPLHALGNSSGDGLVVRGQPASLAFSPDSKLLAVGYFDSSVRLWDVAAGKSLVHVNRSWDLSSPLLAFSPDGQKLAVGLRSRVQLWDLDKLPLEKVGPDEVVQDDPTARPAPPAPKKETAIPIQGAGKLDPHLGGGIDDETKSLLAALPDGTLKCYGYPDLKPKGSAKLPGTAYRAVLDARAKLLYAMVTTKPKGWQARYAGPGELHVYDVRDLLEGKAAEGAALTPKKTLALGFVVSRLLLAPDGSALFCLETQEQKNSRVIRVDAARLEQTAEAPLGPRSKGLWLTRDGKTLYACGDALPPPPPPGMKVGGFFGSALQVFDPATLKVTRTVYLEVTPQNLVATDDGLVYLQGQGIAVLDMKRAHPPAGSWPAGGLGGAISLQLSQDQRRLYLAQGFDGGTFGRPLFECWNVPDDLTDVAQPPPHTGTQLEGRKLEKGEKGDPYGTASEMIVSPDGKYVVVDGGVLFEMKEGGAVTVATAPKPGDNPKPGDTPKPTEAPKPTSRENETLEGHAVLVRYWGAVVDQKSKSVLLTLPNAQMAVYSYPDFKPQTAYKLGGNAYRPALDRDQGLLYALVASLKLKAPAHVKRGGSNEIQVFEAKPILEGKLNAKSEVKPARTYPLEGFVTHMFLSADGKWLYCLDVGDEKSPRVLKLDASNGKTVAEAPLKEGTDVLWPSRDGKSLFTLWHSGQHLPTRAGPYEGGVEWVDTEKMKVKRSLPLAVDAFELDGTDDGIVFVSGGSGKTLDITILDLKQDGDAVLTTWKNFNLPSGLTMRLSDDFKHLYTSSMRGMWIATTPLPEKLAGSDLP
jgi:DNA-binding beta-propeller fold protein YncE